MFTLSVIEPVPGERALTQFQTMVHIP